MDSLSAIDNFVTSFLTGRFWPKENSRYDHERRQPPPTTHDTATGTEPNYAELSLELKKLPTCSVKLPQNFYIYFPEVNAPATYARTHQPPKNRGFEIWAEALRWPVDRYRVKLRKRPRRKEIIRIRAIRDPLWNTSFNYRWAPTVETKRTQKHAQHRIAPACVKYRVSKIREMSKPFPYTYISCPCTETSIPGQSTLQGNSNNAAGGHQDNNKNVKGGDGQAEEDEEITFDPRSARANYSLYPPEHLLYCEDCHQIKCPRCITEEIVCWYCPNCLFETPSSMVRSEGNRCARNCFNCPCCTAPLAVTTLESSESGGSQQGPWILVCGYCMWSTLDVGIKFDKPTNLRAQLSKLDDSRTGNRKPSKTNLNQSVDFKSPLSSFSSTEEQTNKADDKEAGTAPPLEGPPILDPTSRFSALKSFYRTQIAETSTSPADPLMAPEFGNSFSSPSALNRIMSLYTSSGLGGLYGNAGEKPKSKPPVMREALTAGEGLHLPSKEADDAIIRRMVSEECGWEGLASGEQRIAQPSGTRFVEDLRPLPVLLRTKRSKRCKSCKHILVKPEFKPQSTRFRIRLIALSYIPLITLRPLIPPLSIPQAGSSPAVPNALDLNALSPLKPIQFLLTLKNHMFDPIRITLATPSRTPGRVATKVTVLCPQFEVGANSDVWDEALQTSSATDPRLSRSGRAGGGDSGGEKVAEAGKVWEKGRNWTSVVVEVVPGSLTSLEPGGAAIAGLEEDDDVLEIPVFVRVEWEGEGGSEEAMIRPDSRRAEVMTEKRELAYWVVLGVGKIREGL